MSPKIRIPYVCEHDLDVLLLEELSAVPAFFKWFMARVDGPQRARLSSIACTVSSPTGESDLELFLRTTRRTFGFLIEDKLDAALQPEQARRYRQRAEDYVSQGTCDACSTVIVAARQYFSDGQDRKGFDFRIHLEDIVDWFSRSKIGRLRRRYIRALLSTALERGCSGWRLVPDQTVTDFWRRYWELAIRIAPELRMQKPSERPSGSTWIYFKPLDLPGNNQILHKVIPGYIDLQFSGLGNHTAELEHRYKRRLGKGMIIERANRSGVIRIRVPEIDVFAPFNENDPLITKALREAVRLLKWYRRVGSYNLS